MRSEKFAVRLSRSALNSIIAEARRWRVRETGGILIGCWTNERSAMINHVSGPGPRAHHGLYTFEPDSAYAQQQLNAVYEESQGDLSYIGDWHTHPLGALIPSPSDLATTKEVADDPDYRAPQPILLLFRLKLLSVSYQARPLVYLQSHQKFSDADLVIC